MQKTLEALDNLIAKLINTLVSTKFWVMVVTIAIGALTILKEGGTWIEAVLGALMIVSGGGVYTITKYRQNVEYLHNTRELPKPPQAVSPPPTSAPPSSLGSVTPSPELGIDWTQFWGDVEVNKERLMRLTPGKLASFAYWEALQNVGRQYNTRDVDDLYAFARAMYEASLNWWRELAGFDYHEAIEKGVPQEFQNAACPTSDLTLWVRSSKNPAALKLCIGEIRRAAQKINAVNALYSLPQKELAAFWKRYPNGSLTYIYNTLA